MLRTHIIHIYQNIITVYKMSLTNTKTKMREECYILCWFPHNQILLKSLKVVHQGPDGRRKSHRRPGIKPRGVFLQAKIANLLDRMILPLNFMGEFFVFLSGLELNCALSRLELANTRK